MAMVFKFGQMEQNMKVNGLTTKLKARVYFGMQRVMFMMVNSEMIKQMALESTLMLTVPDMKAIGKMICKKVMEAKSGVIMLAIQEPIKKGRSMAMVHITGLIYLSMKETGLRTKLKALAFTLGQMEDNTKVTG